MVLEDLESTPVQETDRKSFPRFTRFRLFCSVGGPATPLNGTSREG